MWHLRGNQGNGYKEGVENDYAIYCIKSLCNLHHSKYEFCCIQVHSLYENPVEILQGKKGTKKHPVQCNILTEPRKGHRVSISLPQVRKSFPQVSKLFPQDSKSLPQVRKSFPQDSKSFPQVRKSFPQVTKSFPQVSKLLPQVTKSFPQVTKSFPQVSKSFPQDSKIAKCLFYGTFIGPSKIF